MGAIPFKIFMHSSFLCLKNQFKKTLKKIVANFKTLCNNKVEAKNEKEKNMTIEDLLDKYEDGYEQIELDYEGDIETYESRWDMPDCLYEEEATGKLEKRTLKIKVRG